MMDCPAQQNPGVPEHRADLPEDLARRVADIVARNMASGRVQRVVTWAREGPAPAEQRPCHSSLEFHPGQALVPGPAEDPHPLTGEVTPDGPPAAYVDQVTATYLREHRRVEALARGDEAAWTELFQQLTQRAHHMLLRMGVPAERAELQAPDLAQQACETIFRQHFPYDVSFDAWASLILKNHIRQRHTRSCDLTEREPRILSLDRPARSETEDDFSLFHLLADPSSLSAFERAETQEWLLQAVGRLGSRAQQQVIIDTFFHELDDGEIAERLGKTRNAVQILRHRGLGRLRIILAE